MALLAAGSDLAGLSREDKELLVLLLAERERRIRRRRFFTYFPDEDVAGPDGRTVIHARRKYPKHLEFFRAGAQYRERCFMAGNRVGKTEGGGGFELTCHLTGLYPHWWEGHRFTRPVKAWAAGKTNETTRDILQAKLLGKAAFEGADKTVDGTGLIPGDLIGRPSWKQGVKDFVDTIPVRHVTGEYSVLGMKSYQQGRGAFEGTEQDVILLDEEPPSDIYNECMIRTAGTTGAASGGIIMLTFTPLEGLTETVLSFLPADQRPDIAT